jgi:hypothetical protein
MLHSYKYYVFGHCLSSCFIYLSSDGFYSDSPLMLGLIYVEFFLMFLMYCLADGLFSAWFVYPILCSCRCPEIGTSSIDWGQLSRFYLKTETGSISETLCFK